MNPSKRARLHLTGRIVNHETLIVPAKEDVERDAVAAAWKSAGGRVLRVDRFWTKPEVDPASSALYGADSFCLVLAQILGLDLVSPADDLLLRVEPVLTKRAIRGESLGAVLAGSFPVFVKPLVPKAFRAAVWQDPEELRAECKGLEQDTPVIASEIVKVLAEARAWVLGRQVLSCAVYEGNAEARDAADFISGCVKVMPLPATCVVDAAFVEGRGWCLLEANAAWGAGLNGCDPGEAIRCIDEATWVANHP